MSKSGNQKRINPKLFQEHEGKKPRRLRRRRDREMLRQLSQQANRFACSAALAGVTAHE